MTYYPGATEAERLANAHKAGEKLGFAQGEIHGLGLQTENAYRQGAEEMREWKNLALEMEWQPNDNGTVTCGMRCGASYSECDEAPRGHYSHCAFNRIRELEPAHKENEESSDG